MGKSKRKYTKEFKIETVRLLENGEKSGPEIERDFGIGRGQIYRWRAKLLSEGIRAFPGNGNVRDEEHARLLKENALLREEREILRKALAIFSRAKR